MFGTLTFVYCILAFVPILLCLLLPETFHECVLCLTYLDAYESRDRSQKSGIISSSQSSSYDSDCQLVANGQLARKLPKVSVINRRILRAIVAVIQYLQIEPEQLYRLYGGHNTTAVNRRNKKRTSKSSMSKGSLSSTGSVRSQQWIRELRMELAREWLRNVDYYLAEMIEIPEKFQQLSHELLASEQFMEKQFIQIEQKLMKIKQISTDAIEQLECFQSQTGTENQDQDQIDGQTSTTTKTLVKDQELIKFELELQCSLHKAGKWKRALDSIRNIKIQL